jgi:hypothetical protein
LQPGYFLPEAAFDLRNYLVDFIWLFSRRRTRISGSDRGQIWLTGGVIAARLG